MKNADDGGDFTGVTPATVEAEAADQGKNHRKIWPAQTAGGSLSEHPLQQHADQNIQHEALDDSRRTRIYKKKKYRKKK